jgi:hypothetical protein
VNSVAHFIERAGLLAHAGPSEDLGRPLSSKRFPRI